MIKTETAAQGMNILSDREFQATEFGLQQFEVESQDGHQSHHAKRTKI